MAEVVDPLHIALSPIDNRPAGPVAHVLEGQFAQNGVDVFHLVKRSVRGV